jgi:hypothetical protein
MSKKTRRNLAAAAAATVLVLRTCNAELKAQHNDFQWPESGSVEAPDFSPEPVCGYGLHGLLWGEGDGSLLNWDDSAKWLVVAVPADSIVSLDGGEKVKFPRGEVVYCGNREGATQLIHAEHAGPIVGLTLQSNAQRNTVCTGYRGTATAGNYGTATAGYRGTATAGNYGTATAGYRGTATAGNYGTATAGYRGTATAGYRGTATAGYRGTATAGNYGTATAGEGGTATAGEGGTATAGNYGTATAGYRGTATAGYRGTATAGNYGTATAGEGGTATAGEGGTLDVQWHDGKRYRRSVAYVGEGGIKPDTKYKLDAKGAFVEVPAPASIAPAWTDIKVTIGGTQIQGVVSIDVKEQK